MREKREILSVVWFVFIAIVLMTFPFWTEAASLWRGSYVKQVAAKDETPEAQPSPVSTSAGETGRALAVSEREVLRGNPVWPYVALTFDADSSPRPLEQILTTMRTKEISATFFIQGSWAEKFPEAVKAIVKDGHEIGNHSYSHLDFRELTEEQIMEELSLTEETLLRVAGVSSKPFFRPPYSYRNEMVRRVTADEGYLTVLWTYDAFDWKCDATEKTIYEEIVGHAEPGAIYVQHVGDANSANVLGRVIEDLRAQGLETVTLSELLAP